MRTIFHVDMDAFFVSVEELYDPSLKGKVVVLGGQPGASHIAPRNLPSRSESERDVWDHKLITLNRDLHPPLLAYTTPGFPADPEMHRSFGRSREPEVQRDATQFARAPDLRMTSVGSFELRKSFWAREFQYDVMLSAAKHLRICHPGSDNPELLHWLEPILAEVSPLGMMRHD